MTQAISRERFRRLIATARMNPEFASRIIQNVSEPLRTELLAELAKPVSPLPGVRKCKPAAHADKSSQIPNNGMSAQLNLFASRVSRVG
ncbi:MAG: hypothetical protein RJA70_4185 [Pseudomonadota bacterium]|jgi:hypothetical protein